MTRTSGSIGFSASGAGLGQDPREFATRALRHCTNRSSIFSIKSGSNTRAGWRTWMFSYVAVSAIDIGFWNGYTTSALSGVETGCGGPLTATLSIEYPRGTFTRVLWTGGGTSGVIADNAIGSTGVFTLPFTIPAFAWFRICGDFQYLAGGTVPSVNWANAANRALGDEYQVGTTADYTMQSNGLTTTGSSAVVIPQYVRTYSTMPVLGVIGDSIAAGVNDTLASPNGGRGILGRAIADELPHVNYGTPGDRAVWYVANSVKRRQLLADAGVSKAILQLGVNDINPGSRTSANIQADRDTIRGLLPSITFVDTTITPQTNSSDSWKTAANQTQKSAGSNTERLAFNNALRTAPATRSSGLLDIASMVETTTAVEFAPVKDGGVWLPRYAFAVGGETADGTHSNSICAEDLKDFVKSQLMAFA